MRLIRLCATLATTALTAALLTAAPAGAAQPDSAGHRASDFYTQDSLWCLYGANKGAKVSYQQVGKIKKEWVNIGEIHTGSNTRGEFFVGSKVTTALAGGLSLNAGDSWSVGASLGYSKSYTIDISLGAIGTSTHKYVQSQFRYQKVRIRCGTTDPRSGIVTWWKSPRWRYLPLGWSGNARYRPGPVSSAWCKTDRGSVPDHRIMLPHGQKKRVGWAEEYTTTVGLSGIGVTASMSSSTGNTKAVQFWTTKGRAWICGNESTIEDSSKFYANNY